MPGVMPRHADAAPIVLEQRFTLPSPNSRTTLKTKDLQNRTRLGIPQFFGGRFRFSEGSSPFKETLARLRLVLLYWQFHSILRKSKRLGIPVLPHVGYLCTHPRISPSSILRRTPHVHVRETSLFLIGSKPGRGARLHSPVRKDELGGGHADGRVGDGPPRPSAASSSDLLAALCCIGLCCPSAWHTTRSNTSGPAA